MKNVLTVPNPSAGSWLRSSGAVVTGLLVITLLVEPMEFGLVTLLHGGVTTDPEVYFGVRNRPWVLVLKLIYNTGAAIIGGLIAARIARRAPMAHGAALAAVQTAGFGWAVLNPELRRGTPDVMWALLTVLTIAGILFGARLSRRQAPTR
jgi:hypothetical protein